MVVGRDGEVAQVRTLLDAAAGGRGGALVIAGEPRIGKTSLMRTAVDLAEGFVVVELSGVQAERDLPFAGVNDLVAALGSERARLRPELRRAADPVLDGVHGPRAPNRLAIGGAVLAALAGAATRRPVLLCVDDLQWLDAPSADAIAFAAPRVGAEAVALLLARRTGTGDDTFLPTGGLPEIVLDGLSTEAATTLWPQAHPNLLATLVEASGGNPLAVGAALADLDAEVVAGHRPLRTIPVTDPERIFASRLSALDPRARAAARVLAVSGAAPREIVLRALQEAGLAVDALAPVEERGMAVLRDRVAWLHPLVRSAAGRGTTAEQQATHAALARAWSDHPDHPAFAWHRAEATTGPDDELADGLAAAAGVAERKEATADAAAAWERAARLTAAPDRRSERFEAAARCAVGAGLTRRGADLLDEALQQRPSAAELLALRARVEHTLGNPALAWDLFMQAVDLAGTRDLRVRASAESLYAAMYCDDPALATRAARLVEAHHDATVPEHVFLREHASGAAAALRGDPDTAVLCFDRAALVLEQAGLLDRRPELLLWAVNMDLFAGITRLLPPSIAAAVARQRAGGDLTWLPRIVRLVAMRRVELGDWGIASAELEDAELLSRMSGQVTQIAEALISLAEIEAPRGLAAGCLRRAGEAREIVTRHDIRWLAGSAEAAQGRLHLSLGDPAEAVTPLRASLRWFVGPQVHDYVDAVRLTAGTAAARQCLDEVPGAGESDRALVRLLLADDAATSRELLRLVAPGQRDFPAARLHLAAGQRLRRAGERREARSVLRAAGEMFHRMGARPWAERVDAELRASGATLRRKPEPDALTPSEQRVASLVARGQSNRDVAAQLFLSPKTVEFHLGRVFRKLGVQNRTALARALADHAAR